VTPRPQPREVSFWRPRCQLRQFTHRRHLPELASRQASARQRRSSATKSGGDMTLCHGFARMAVLAGMFSVVSNAHEANQLQSYGNTDTALQSDVTKKTGFIDVAGIQGTPGFSLPTGATAADSYDGGKVDFYGTEHASFGNGVAYITIDGIKNYTSTYTTGSLRIDLWALQAPYYGGSFTGYKTASVRTNQVTGLSDQLGPGQYFYNISLQLVYAAPGNPSYNQYVLMLQEYSADPSVCPYSDHYCVIAAVNLQPTSSGNKPTCSPSANPASLPATGGYVSLSANCSNSPTSYSWTLNGAYASSSGSFTYSVPANTTSSTKTYSFSVTASNAYGTGNGSVSVQVAGSAPPPPNHVEAPLPNSSPCVRNANTACLLNGRFRVQANWSASPGGVGGATSVTYFGGSRAETDNAAVLWFQDPNFFEIGVTLYNGCSYGGVPNTWVFIGGLTDWSWAMTITDTAHGTYKQYFSPYGAVTQTTTDYAGFSCN
jgi:hypothetical protein